MLNRRWSEEEEEEEPLSSSSIIQESSQERDTTRCDEGRDRTRHVTCHALHPSFVHGVDQKHFSDTDYRHYPITHSRSHQFLQHVYLIHT